VQPTRRVPSRRRWTAIIGFVLAAVATIQPAPEPTAAATVVELGFQVASVFDGYRLDTPTAMAFAPDGRVFVTERAGRVLAFDGIADPSPTLVMDLSTRVHAVGDRGLLGLAVHPSFSTSPYIYVTYILDAPVSGSPVPYYRDECPPSPNGSRDGCPAPGRLSRIQVGADSRAIGSEQVVIGGQFWCHAQQGHALDHVAFGPDGALYVTSGDGAAGSFQDYGQHSGATGGVPSNACGDPPVPVGDRLTLPTTQGGALRSQDLLTPADPTSGNGAILRVNAETGAALPTNPLVGNSVPDDDRHIAFGLRNPFRFTFRPGTHEVWIGDVGWNQWEEVNVVPSPTDATVENFGWPCHEGPERNAQWDNLNVQLCEQLYAGQHGSVTAPRWAYRHGQSPDTQRCGNAGSAISGLAFSQGLPYPSRYDGALFVADYVKACLWAIPAGANGLPDPTGIHTIISGVAPVDLEIGPDGRLYYVDIAAGTVNRINYSSGNQPPVARVSATPSSGPAPLAVTFDASASTDDRPVTELSYAWDLDGDGSFDDGTGVTAQRTYAPGTVTVRVRVTDASGSSAVAQVTVQSGNTAPVADILRPTAADRWSTGADLVFEGRASDVDQPTIGAANMRWDFILHHCVTQADCHAHPQSSLAGVASGSFNAPEHDYPAYIEVRLTVTDAHGLTDTDSVRVDPRTIALTLRSEPPGLHLSAGLSTGASPLTITAISGSRTVISAPDRQMLGGTEYRFQSWSDGGGASHDVIAGTADATLTARYVAASGPSVVRRAGADRYATAAALSAGTFTSASVVHVATGRNFPDALAAAAAAGSRHGPVLLVDRAAVPAATAAELRRLGPDQIVIVGGTGVVSGTVEQQLGSYAPSVVRRAGADRYATAAALSAGTFTSASVVHVATGRNFPDALAAAAAAGSRHGPVLLVDRAAVPAATAAELRRLGPDQIVIVGGTGVVSSTVEQQLRR
jgi:glucose/arabinose dehydrogenase/putative cell wall-binding protein